jgi:hypothetical protein
MPMNIRFARALLLGCAFLTVISGAAIAADAKAAAPVNPATTASETYAPGLGDFMTAYVQPHHIKLWLAGSSGYWKLAAYEADELGETFDDISSYQAVWKSIPVAQLVKAMIEPALKNLRAPMPRSPLPAIPATWRLNMNSYRSGCRPPIPSPTRTSQQVSASAASNI